ncbi:hypothetical protein TNCV_4726771 [Trichonephila clavipes]|nr:hypothetical protein TNCV_4726771 [Trichonephila clavipes]
MACDAEDFGFQMLNDDEMGTSVQEESDPVDDEMDEDEDNTTTTKVARIRQIPTRTVLKFGKRIPFIEYRSPTEWVLGKSTPKWRCRELSGVIELKSNHDFLGKCDIQIQAPSVNSICNVFLDMEKSYVVNCCFVVVSATYPMLPDRGPRNSFRERAS